MLTQDLLKEVFEYNTEHGTLHWKTSRGSAAAGSQAGHIQPDGYVIVGLGGKYHKAHRLIWLMTYGNLPKNSWIDHQNGDTGDNRLENLRLATHQENQQNSALSRGNKTGFKGVSTKGSRYQANLRVGRKQTYVGTYDTAKDAAAAYDLAAHKEFGVFARTNAMMGLR